MDKVILVLKLLPAIIEAMKALEQAFPAKGAGETKLQALREVLEVLDSSMTALWPSVEKVVQVLVKAFNATGVFQK